MAFENPAPSLPYKAPAPFEDEILDRPLSANPWTFSCCMSISEEDKAPARKAAKIRSHFEDEVLDRPWLADGFYTICCTMGISPDDDHDRPAAARPVAGLEDEILDRALMADGFTVCCCLSGGITPDGEMPERPTMATAVAASNADTDVMVDVMLVAGAALLIDEGRTTS